MIMKPGPDFGKRILRPQLSPDDPLKDPGFCGFWIQRPVSCFKHLLCDFGFWIFRQKISIELVRAQISTFLPAARSHGFRFWILDLAWHLADLMPRVLVSKVTPPPPPSWIPDLGYSLISTGTTTKFLPYLGRNPKS